MGLNIINEWNIKNMFIFVFENSCICEYMDFYLFWLIVIKI